MATVEECQAALDHIVARLAEVDRQQFAEHAVDRTVSCRIPDLGLTFGSRIHPGGLDSFQAMGGDGRGAQVRVTVNSDDLVALAADELHVAKAWVTGRLRIEASIGDLLRIRRFL